LRVRDRHGNLISLTEERWGHIVQYRPELEEQYDEVLATIRFGRRRQDPLDPVKYKYILPCLTLPFGMTHIVVVVKMGRAPFVLPAYGVEKYVKS
jgi:hypothetical protein